MCGIFGFSGGKNKELLEKMELVLKHRGPDETVFYSNGKINLGMVRLSILDLRKNIYPITNEDNSLILVYNGEIYNFMELKKELEKKGHKFKTKTDAEVIVHSYEEYGESAIKKFKGMFAFALYDKKRDILMLGRDRFGIKPLYYHIDNKNFIFSSEIKGILEKKDKYLPNESIIYDYLHNSLCDHKKETFFETIYRLEPATYMILNKGGIFKIKRYWNLKKKKFSEKNFEEVFLDLFKSSIKDHLISEVPIGSCLSGGLDSTSIVCTINSLIKNKVIKEEKGIIGKKQKIFSAVYPGEKIDERGYIEEVIKKTLVEKNFVYPNPKGLWSDLKKMVWHQDEPFRTSSIFAQWEVMKSAKTKKIKVLLDGQGGDELCAGYLPYYGIYLKDLIKKGHLVSFIIEAIFSLDIQIKLIGSYINHKKGQKTLKKISKKDFLINFLSQKNKWDLNKSLNQRIYLDITKESIPALLRYEDRNSMAFSIESRVPFLDHSLAEYCYSLPKKKKLNRGWNKVILRRAMQDLIPKKIQYRRDKIGFETPESKWLRYLKKEIIELFSSKEFRCKNYFDQKLVLEEFKKFCKNNKKNYLSPLFWKIINLEIWMRVFF